MTRIEDTLKNLKHLSMPAEVKGRMREELMAYAELHAATPIVSPLSRTIQTYTYRLYAGFAAMLLVIIGVGGTAYASSDSLPGDTLYSFKIHVSEPIQTALVPSERGKASWHAILAERRLEEAAQLAAQNELTAETQEELAIHLNTHIEESDQSADRLELSGDTAGSLSVRSDLEARLAAHGVILNVIAAHYAEASSTEPTHLALAKMLAVVNERETAATSARLALEDQIVPGIHAPANAATMSMKAAIEPVEDAMPADIATEAQARIEKAEAFRTKEVESIIDRHAVLLAKFLPTATTSATTTATTTEEVNEKPRKEVNISIPTPALELR